MASFIKTLDDAMKVLVFTKFSPYFSLVNSASDIVFAPESIAQRQVAEKRGANQLEFISLWRTGIIFDWERQRSPVARRGINLRYTDEDSKESIVTVKAVPAKITYDLYFWSKDLDKVVEATENYVFWQHVNPNLLFSYGDQYPMQMNLHFGSVTDVSPLAQAYEKGIYFVYKMPIVLDGWIFALESTKTILKIVLDIYYTEGELSTATIDNSTFLVSYNITEHT
jgi:hypothetical protein